MAISLVTDHVYLQTPIELGLTTLCCVNVSIFIDLCTFSVFNECFLPVYTILCIKTNIMLDAMLLYTLRLTKMILPATEQQQVYMYIFV